MDASEIVVLVGGVTAIVGIGWYFLGPRATTGARAHNSSEKETERP